jgi:cell filamentation protein
LPGAASIAPGRSWCIREPSLTRPYAVGGKAATIRLKPQSTAIRPAQRTYKLSLSTAAGLEAAEREITHTALILLHESPISPGCDLPHLREIHKRIVGGIYEWAGQIRTVAMAKGAMFCLPQYIDSSAAIIFRELHDEDCLRGLSRDAFVGRLAYYLGEVNALHPFREGNGRAQRAFFAQLARSTGFTLAWQHLDAAQC